MLVQPQESGRSLRILHVLRAPLGGLFRHVLDLTREQVARGHEVGLITDSSTGGEVAARTLADLAPILALGVTRVPIRRNPHVSDMPALLHVLRRMRATHPDVVHGHGSKGGVLARLPGLVPGFRTARRAYTPHGGSLNHRPGTAVHRLYMAAEGFMRQQTDLLLFESGFIASRYGSFVGRPPRFNRVIHNGIAASEFEPVGLVPHATDLLYVGELRFAKGVDTLLAALAAIKAKGGATPSLTLVGSGPDRMSLEHQVNALGLADTTNFRDPMPARKAFTLGRVLVIPSRAESLPYIVLEAAGAAVPMVATNVGGIPEIYGPFRRQLIPADDVEALAGALETVLSMSVAERQALSQPLARHVASRFSIDVMVDGVMAAYRDVLANRHPGRSNPPHPQIVLSS